MQAAAKWILGIAAVVLTVLLLAVGSITVVMNTEAGTRWALDRIVEFVPGQIRMENVNGTFWRGLRFARLVYRDASREIDASGLELSVSWLTLPGRRLTLSQLTAGSVAYTSLSPRTTGGDPLQVSIAAPPVDLSVIRAQVGMFTYAGAQEPVRVEDILLTRLRTEGTVIRVVGAGAVSRNVQVSAAGLRMQMAGSVPLSAEITWELIGGEWSGSGAIDGSLAEIDFEQVVDGPLPARVSGRLALTGDTSPSISASINWSRWIIDDVELTNGDARFEGWPSQYDVYLESATVAVGGQTAVGTGTATGNLEHLQRLALQLDSELGSADINGSVSWVPDLIAVGNIRAEGSFEAINWTGAGDLAVTAGSVHCRNCILSSGRNQLKFDGEIAQGAARVSLQFDAPDPQQISPGLSGALRGQGTLTGQVGDPLLDVGLSGERLHLGPPEAPPLDLEARMTLHRADSGVLARILAATLSEEKTGVWMLEGPFDVLMAPATLQLGEHSWAGANGLLHVSGFETAGDTTRIAADIDRLPLALADGWLPDDLRLLGFARADADLVLSDGAWSGSASWQQEDTILQARHSAGAIAEVMIPHVSMSLQLTDGRLVAEAELAVEPGVTGQLSLELDALQADAPMQGELRFAGEDWAWVSAIVPEIDRIDGAITGSMAALGPLNAPELSGEVQWRDGSLTVPALNVPFDEINMLISGASAGTATISGSAKAGNGQIALNGYLRDVMQSQRSIDLRLTGDNAELINWPEYRIWATPDLGLTGDTAGWKVDGRLVLPRAEVRLRELPAGAVEISPDAEILGATVEAPRPLRITGDTTLTLGDRVRVNALGLDTSLKGELQLRFRENRDPAAVGRVTLVDGVFEAHGQRLTITQGELTFTGPLDDPLVDVRAVRVIETIDGTVTAGIHLTGRATNLTSTVFSEPAMPDSDALSYLVVGRPLNQATEAEGADVSGAAVALGIKQATRIVEQIGQSLGLDQLSVTGDGGDATALIAGKQINRRMYARYAYGIFTRLGTLLVRYRMTERLTLEAGTGENQSIDVLYSIEAD